MTELPRQINCKLQAGYSTLHYWPQAILLFIYLFAQKTTLITVTKAPLHELVKKANKPALTIAHKMHTIYRYIHNTSKFDQSVNQSIT